MTAKIPVGARAVALIDRSELRRVAPYRWFLVKRGKYTYVAGTRYVAGKRRQVYLHRLIARAPRGMVVDHRNHDTLDNRRSNLRRCSVAQNVRNARGKKHSSRFKGVYWNKRDRKWIAQIGFERRHWAIGRFLNEEDAALAYNAEAVKLFGEYALLNEVST